MKELNLIVKEVRKLFKGNTNLKQCKCYGDFISLDFKDVNNCPVKEQDMHEFINQGLLQVGIDLKSKGLTICYCDGDYMSIQEMFITQ